MTYSYICISYEPTFKSTPFFPNFDSAILWEYGGLQFVTAAARCRISKSEAHTGTEWRLYHSRIGEQIRRRANH